MAVRARRDAVYACLVLLGGAGPAVAQPAPAPPAEPPVLVPPRPLAEPAAPYPDDAPDHDEPVVVRVRLRIDETGRVTEVAPLEAAPPAFARAVERAALGFSFEPARYGGVPVAVDIRFSQTFVPPVRPPPARPASPGEPVDAGPVTDARLEGRLRERGTRRPVAGATVLATMEAGRFSAESDAAGAFTLPLPSGEARIDVVSSKHRPFRQRETLAADEALRVDYLLDRRSYDPYSTVVVGHRVRTEVARIELRGKEIKQIPGTFGDPFRVIHTLPGVASVMSLLPFPVVRGSSPGNTGFLIDGTRVPLLFHLMAGPSVIHPDFIDAIRFYPGAFPVEYGGYTGGIVDGQTRRAPEDDLHVDVNLDLFQAGGLVRTPVEPLGAVVTAAGRIGYPGVLISLINDNVWLSYWDYQLRVDGGTPASGWTLFAFGASDTVEAAVAQGEGEEQEEDPELEPVLRMGFHRLDLRYHHRRGKVSGVHQLVLGMDDALAGPGAGLQAWHAGPRLQWRFDLRPGLEVRVGGDGTVCKTDTETEEGAADSERGTSPMATLTEDVETFWTGGLFAELLWRPRPRLLVRPGFRSEVYRDVKTPRAAIDPRLSARYRLTGGDGAASPDEEAAAWWVKGAVGSFHQPPRFLFPLPGLDQLPLEHGLLRAIQSSVGLEGPVPGGLSVDVQAFFHWQDPVIFDLQVNQALEDVGNQVPGVAPGEPRRREEGDRGEERLEAMYAPQVGRSYGVEVLLRRRSQTGIYGWISYTLSRAERLRDGEWVVFDFDRPHILNLVVGIPLPRSWELGLRVQVQTGKPVTTTHGYNTARTDPYVRFDLRVDKRAVWNDWMLDFYVDVTNATLYPEEVAPGSEARYVLPTVGFRGVL